MAAAVTTIRSKGACSLHPFTQGQRLRHPTDNDRRAQSLMAADRQRRILVGLVAESFGNEEFAG